MKDSTERKCAVYYYHDSLIIGVFDNSKEAQSWVDDNLYGWRYEICDLCDPNDFDKRYCKK